MKRFASDFSSFVRACRALARARREARRQQGAFLADWRASAVSWAKSRAFWLSQLVEVES